MFERRRELLASGMSEEAADAFLVSSEWEDTSAGLHRLDATVDKVGFKLNVILGLTFLKLCLTDCDAIPHSLMGKFLNVLFN